MGVGYRCSSVIEAEAGASAFFSLAFEFVILGLYEMLGNLEWEHKNENNSK